MKALIISDIHDHLSNLNRVLTHHAASECDVLLCCGDLCSPFVVDIVHELWKGPAHMVFGNNDGDRFMISKKVHNANTGRVGSNRIQLHGEYLFKEAGVVMEGMPDEIILTMTHYPDIASRLSGKPGRQLITYGHSHIPDLKISGDTLIVNPGSVMGYIPSEKKTTAPSFTVVDMRELKADLIQIDGDE